MFSSFFNISSKIVLNVKKLQSIKSLSDKNNFQVNFGKNLLQMAETTSGSNKPQQQNFALDAFIAPQLFRVKTIPQQYSKEDQVLRSQKQQKFITSKFHKNEIANRIKQYQYAANKPIQDKMNSAQLDSIPAYTLSIFDGHGGDQLSKYASQKISQYIDLNIAKEIKNKKPNEKQLQEIIKNSITNAYAQVQNHFFQSYQGMLQLHNSQIASVGSCGITVLIHNKKIYIANLGDSQAIIITQNQGNFNFIKGNERHSVNNSTQRKRIQQKFLGRDNQVLTKDQKGRYYIKGRLQPTRCLGDYYLKKEKYYKKFCGSSQFNGPYIEHLPQISVFQIQQDFKYIVVASDGIWDFLSKWDVVKLIAQTQMKKKKLQKSIEKQQQQIDLSKTYQQIPSQNETVEQKLIQQVLKKCSKNKRITVKQLENIKEGEKRNYFDDISIGIINLQSQM